MISLKDFIGELTPGGVGVWVGVTFMLLHFLREWRESKRMSIEDREARKAGYSAQVTTLMKENRGLRGDLNALENKHDRYRAQCEAETDQLRRLLREALDDLATIKRAMASGTSPSFRSEQLTFNPQTGVTRLDRR